MELLATSGLHIDIGGEGRYVDAVNVNPVATRMDGTPIPSHVKGVGESLPFPDHVADRITLEGAPVHPGTPREIARVIRGGGIISLSSPYDYGLAAHAAVAREVRGTTYQTVQDSNGVEILNTIIIAPQPASLFAAVQPAA
jgi:hypothetical protein